MAFKFPKMSPVESAVQTPPESSSEATSLKSLKWLVTSRSKIQELLLRLDANPNHPRAREWHLHVGAAFSLWRAVFLCHNADDFKQKLEPGAKHILRKTIEQNTINFSDDVKASAWSGGYYINNALFRLGLRTVARPAHKSQKTLWEEAYAELDRLVPELPEVEKSPSGTSGPTGSKKKKVKFADLRDLAP